MLMQLALIAVEASSSHVGVTVDEVTDVPAELRAAVNAAAKDALDAAGLIAVSWGESISDECLMTTECRSAALQRHDNAAVIVLTLVRAARLVQTTVRVFSPDEDTPVLESSLTSQGGSGTAGVVQAAIEQAARVLIERGILLAAKDPPAPVRAEPAVVATAPAPSIVPWVIAASGAAAAISGAFLLGLAVEQNDQLANAPDGAQPADYFGAAQNVTAYSTAGFVLLGVGSAALVGGLAWGLIDSDDELAFAPHPSGFAVYGRF